MTAPFNHHPDPANPDTHVPEPRSASGTEGAQEWRLVDRNMLYVGDEFVALIHRGKPERLLELHRAALQTDREQGEASEELVDRAMRQLHPAYNNETKGWGIYAREKEILHELLAAREQAGGDTKTLSEKWETEAATIAEFNPVVAAAIRDCARELRARTSTEKKENQ